MHSRLWTNYYPQYVLSRFLGLWVKSDSKISWHDRCVLYCVNSRIILRIFETFIMNSWIPVQRLGNIPLCTGHTLKYTSRAYVNGRESWIYNLWDYSIGDAQSCALLPVVTAETSPITWKWLPTRSNHGRFTQNPQLWPQQTFQVLYWYAWWLPFFAVPWQATVYIDRHRGCALVPLHP
jgi:hypothetical protein